MHAPSQKKTYPRRGRLGHGDCNDAPRGLHTAASPRHRRSSGPVVSGTLTAAAGSGVHHTVRKGETLWRISKTYGVALAEIVEANGLANYTIAVNQKLHHTGGVAGSSAIKLAGAGSRPRPALPGGVTRSWRGRWRVAAEVPSRAASVPRRPRSRAAGVPQGDRHRRRPRGARAVGAGAARSSSRDG